MVKNPPAMQETQVQSLDQDDPLEKKNGNPLQYSCLGNPMDRGATWATVHGITKSQTRLRNKPTTTIHIYIYDIIILNPLGSHSAAINGKPSRDLQVEICVSRWQSLVGKAPLHQCH